MKYMQLTDGTIIETENPELWREGKKLTQKEGKRLKIEQSANKLRQWLKPGDTVITILRHVSHSGMSRRISLVICQDGELFDISGWAADVLEARRHDRDGSIIVGGCGMDMGFHLVYRLSRRLFPKGFKVEGVGRNGNTSGHDTDGGYALKHRWL